MLVYGVGGWIRVDESDVPGLPGPLYLRLAARGGVSDLYLAAEGGREVTAAQLREIPLGRLRAMGNSRSDILAGMMSAPGPAILDQLDRAFPKRRRLKDAPDTSARLSPPASGLDDDFLRQVAAAYAAAVARGERPNRSLAEQVGHEKTRTVESWVYLARKRGFLPKGRPGAVG